MSNGPSLTEISISCIDLLATERWFREGLGFRTAGGRRIFSNRPMADAAMDPPGSEAMLWWMVGGDPGCRLALHQFSLPFPRLAGLEVGAPGYEALMVEASCFDTRLAALEALGSPVIGVVTGERGQRRASVRSPDAFLVHLVEASAASDGSARLSGVALKAVDPDRAARRFGALLGAEPGEIAPRRFTFDCGGVALQIEPSGDTVAPERIDRRPSDQGLFGIGLSYPSQSACEGALARAGADWAVRSSAQPDSDGARSHLSGPEGVSVKAEWTSRSMQPGFKPRAAHRSPPPARHHVHATAVIAAPLARVWAALNDHARMGQWIEADEFEVMRHGEPHSAGYGAERRLQTMGREVFQQVTRVYPLHIGYRATKSPFAYHNGTVDIATCEGGTRIDWRIRYRTAGDRRIGDVILPQLQAGIENMLGKFRAMVEAEAPTER